MLVLRNVHAGTPVTPMRDREKDALTSQLAEAQKRLVDERAKTIQGRVRLEEQQDTSQRLDEIGKQHANDAVLDKKPPPAAISRNSNSRMSAATERRGGTHYKYTDGDSVLHSDDTDGIRRPPHDRLHNDAAAVSAW